MKLISPPLEPVPRSVRDWEAKLAEQALGARDEIIET